MIATIAKRFTFDAAHRLPNCPPDHKCFNLHGHTYTVEVVLTGPVDPMTGFVVDYDRIAEAWAPLGKLLDHSYLNDVDGLENPSTEVLGAWIAKRLVDGSELLIGVPAPPLASTAPDPYAFTAAVLGAQHAFTAAVLGAHGAYRPTTLVTKVRVCESSTTWCEVEVSGPRARPMGVPCNRIPWIEAVQQLPFVSA